MIVEDNKKGDQIDKKGMFSYLDIGDVFVFKNQIFVKIGTFSCLDMENSRIEDIYSEETVIKVKAKLVIEE